jgi:hypothetical protein
MYSEYMKSQLQSGKGQTKSELQVDKYTLALSETLKLQVGYP